LGVLVLLAGCSAESNVKRGKEYFSEKEYGVKASPRVVQLGQPAPKGGGRIVTGKPYKVKDKWYYPDDSTHPETGIASWYGSAFHGRLTANGEVYDINSITAAHPTMPLPSYARVTNLSNGRSIVVRVNDRGPYHADRVIDLSSRVADILDVKSHGTARVKVQYVGPARMDGLDENTLLASYRVGGSANDTMIAAAPRPRAHSNVVLASSTVPLPAPKLKPRFKPDNTGWDSIDDVIYGEGEQIAPSRAGYAVPRPADSGDPIGRLIRPGSSVRSYAADGFDYLVDPDATESIRQTRIQAGIR
jgi:rare lipoprotein A